MFKNKFFYILMVMLTMFSITVSARKGNDKDQRLSCDGPYVIYQPDGKVRRRLTTRLSLP